MIHRAHTRLAVVFAAGRDGGGIERVDLGARRGGERDMGLVRSRTALREPELRAAVLAHAGETVEFCDDGDVERLQRALVERFRALEVGYRDRQVIEDHVVTPRAFLRR